jgi:hypothetical protein
VLLRCRLTRKFSHIDCDANTAVIFKSRQAIERLDENVANPDQGKEQSEHMHVMFKKRVQECSERARIKVFFLFRLVLLPGTVAPLHAPAMMNNVFIKK